MPCWSAQCTPAVQGVAAARSESAAAAFIAIIIWSARASVVRLISLRTYERLLAWSPYTQVSLEVRRHDKTRSKSGFRGYNEKRSYKKKKTRQAVFTVLDSRMLLCFIFEAVSSGYSLI